MDSTASDRLVGRLLERRYRVDALIARGGMATVYEATDIRLERRVALKVMRRSLADDAGFTHRLAREARASANLAHPHIVGVFDHGEDEGVLFLAMEFVPGRHTLRDLVRDEAPLPPGRTLALLDQVLQGIEVAHESGIIHRDIKPENVLLNPRGQVKVADFGLARAVSSASTVTATASGLMGTMAYLPPELVTEGRADARSDVYSLGVITYEMLTGVQPHDGENPMQIAYSHVHHDVPAPSIRVPGLPDYLDAFVARATARDRDRRPADAHVMRHQLRRVRHALDQGVTADPELASDLAPSPDRAVRRRSWEDDVPGLVSSAHEQDGGPEDFDATETRPVPTWRQRAASPEHPTTVIGLDHASDAEAESPLPDGVAADYPDATHTQVISAGTPRAHDDAPDPSSSTRDLGIDDSDNGADDATRAAAPAALARRRRNRGWIILLVVLVLAFLAALGGWWLAEGRYQSAPHVVGLQRQQAVQTLARQNYAVEFAEPVFSEEVARGDVVTTSPAPGDDILPGGTVAITLSRGPERYDVPRVSGMPVGQARQALANNNLQAGAVTWRWSEEVPESRVMAATPPPGERVRPDTRVDLVASKGRRPIEISDYTGDDASAATAQLRDAGFAVDVSRRFHGSVAAGEVISQAPGSGTGYRGDTIAVTVSKGPPLVEVPSVQSSNIDVAEELLEAAGFEVEVRSASVDFGLNIVVDSSPEGGALAPRGSTVVLTVT